MSKYPEFRVWTPQEEAELLSCLKSGMTYEQTARQINRSVKATKGRYYRLTAAAPEKRVERPARVYKHPGDMPAKPMFMNPHAQEMISRASRRAEKMILAGTPPTAALNMIFQETGIRLNPADFQNPDEFGPIPVGESVKRVMSEIERMYAINGIKAGA